MIEIKIQKRLFFLWKWGGEPRQVNSTALMEKKKTKQNKQKLSGKPMKKRSATRFSIY